MHERKLQLGSVDVDDVLSARGQAWMTVFSDVLLLLLTFFVLRFSMLSLDGESLARAFSKFDAAATNGPPPMAAGLTTATLVTSPQQLQPNYLITALADGLAAADGEAAIPREEGGVITYNNSTLLQPLPDGALIRLPWGSFLSGEAELSFLATRLLSGIARSAAAEGASIEVRVWVSASESVESSYPTVWELSRARAERILRQLLDAGFPASAISLAPRGDFALPERGSTENAKNGVELMIKTINK